MKLLVTGGYGFIGSNFILKLLEEHTEFKIKNVDAELTGSNPKNLSKIKDHENYEFVKGDITDRELM
jgi:dTDP-glucose 4,6-dehydratase